MPKKKVKGSKAKRQLAKFHAVVASQQETIHKLTAKTFENANMRDELNVRRSLMLEFQQEKNDLLGEIAGLKKKLAEMTEVSPIVWDTDDEGRPIVQKVASGKRRSKGHRKGGRS